MRRYLETIHTKPDAHKKRFALLVSLSATILIFGIWFTATFDSEVRQVTTGDNEQVDEVSSLESLKASVGSVLRVLRTDVDDLESGLETVNRYGR